MATRKASGAVLKALGPVIPELWGGSADLAGLQQHHVRGRVSFLPEGNPLPGADPYGRTVHFGIREHAMGATMNGIALHGNTRSTAARSSSSPTTCVPPSGSPR